MPMLLCLGLIDRLDEDPEFMNSHVLFIAQLYSNVSKC